MPFGSLPQIFHQAIQLLGQVFHCQPIYYNGLVNLHYSSAADNYPCLLE